MSLRKGGSHRSITPNARSLSRDTSSEPEQSNQSNFSGSTFKFSAVLVKNHLPRKEKKHAIYIDPLPTGVFLNHGCPVVRD